MSDFVVGRLLTRTLPHTDSGRAHPPDIVPGMSSSKAKRAEFFLEVLRNQGVPIGPGTKVLDLGCGAGKLVQAARERGYDFHGCEIGRAHV